MGQDDKTAEALERENVALRGRVAELERKLARFKAGEPDPRLGHALGEREALLLEAERIAHMGSWVWDVAEDHVMWSDELYRILGYDPGRDQASTAAFFAAVHPEDVERVRDASARAIRTGVSEQVDFRVLRRDGTSRSVSMAGALLYDAEGELKRAVGAVLDLTEATNAAHALERSGYLLEETQRIANTGSWEWCLDTGAITWSQQLYRITRIDPSEQPSLELLRELVHPDDWARVDRAVARSVDTREGATEDCRFILRDGSLRHVHMVAMPALESRGRPNVFRGTVTDVTEQVELEASLRQAQKMDAIGRLAGGVAHDFNNLLTVILGNLDLLPRESRTLEVENIATAARSAAQLTQQLLTFGRRAILRRTRIDLNRAIESGRAIVERTLGEHIETRIQLGADLWPVRADQGLVHQVLLNLVVNARDAMPGGGRLTISTQNVEVAPAAARGGEVPPGDFVCLSVRDSGVGMSTEVLEHVFDPFFTTKDVGRGTGLGLAMVFGAMKQSGGFVEVSSELGRGSTFSLYFPRLPPSLRDDELDAGDAVAQLPYRVLLVEDDDGVAAVLTNLLSSAGGEVRRAGRPSDAEALWLADSEWAQLLIVDIMMPEMRGPELVRRLRARRVDLPVLYITGYASDGEPIVLEAGRVGLLLKPFTGEELARAVHALMG